LNPPHAFGIAGLIGWPVAQSRSPVIHNHWLAQHGIAGRYVLFPVPPDVFKAKMEYRDFKGGETLAPAAGIVLRTAVLNHPDGATGYRIEFRGKSVCYVTDTEHVPGKPDKNVLGLIQGADIVIYDCMYTDEEYAKSYVGWGHSTWQEGVRMCKAAGAKKLVVFHHDPDHDDDKLDAIGREVEAALPGALMAREGLELHL